MNVVVAEKDDTIIKVKIELDETKCKLNEMTDKLNKKLNLIKEYENDLEKERQ
jgi:hypothetical protein